MIVRVLLGVVICFSVGSYSFGETDEQVPLNPEAGVYTIAPYRYVLTEVVANSGETTKVGTLFRGNKQVTGADFYRLKLPIGSFIWHPSKPSNYSNSSQVGWIRINPLKKYSAWSMAYIESNSASDAKVLRTLPRNPLPKKSPDTSGLEFAPDKVQ